MKYGDVTLGQVEAAINKLGGRGVWDAWLRGEKTVTVEDAIRLLFDKHGRRIPENLRASVCDANTNFRLNQPGLDYDAQYANRIMRLHGCLAVDTGSTAEQLRIETERLLALIRGNAQIANIVNGVWLPVVMPPFVGDDLGTVLEQYLEGVDKSYVKTFSDRRFNNYRKGTLAGKVSVVDGSRHDQLTDRMKQGSVMGIHFPNPLQGYSISADREQMKTLPRGFILSGVDALIAMMMYPEILARDGDTPGLGLAAFSWQSVDYSLLFTASGENLGFVHMDNLVYARGNCSGGLLFLG